MRILDRSEIDLLVWERGVGLTQACGTGACAAVAAFVKAGRLDSNKAVRVNLRGGSLFVTVASKDGSIELSGPARKVFDGVIHKLD